MKLPSRIIHLDTVSSTNSYALALIKNEQPEEGTIISAAFQSGGKGQAGSRWESEKNMNLLFSIILYPVFLKPERQFMLSMVVSLGIATVLEKIINNIRIKWPNDIYSGHDKIAGILIENAVAGTEMVYSVAGIGLNVNQTTFPPSLPNPASLKMLTGMHFNHDTLLGNILTETGNLYSSLRRGGKALIENEYHARLYRKNEKHRFSTRTSEFTGIIRGVDNYGRLVVEDNDSMEAKTFSFKEIEYL